MKAEVGFMRDSSYRPTDHMRLVIQAQSETEGTSLLMFATQAGLTYDEPSGTLIIEEPDTHASKDAPNP